MTRDGFLICDFFTTKEKSSVFVYENEGKKEYFKINCNNKETLCSYCERADSSKDVPAIYSATFMEYQDNNDGEAKKVCLAHAQLLLEAEENIKFEFIL